MAGEGVDLREHIANLLQSRMYDPEIIPELEEYINYQVAHSVYDADANLACLKLYQFYPERYQGPIVSKILVKAMMSLPEPTFLCSLYLIPEKFQVEGGPIPVLSSLVTMLETGKYMEFWETVGSHKHLFAGVKGFEDAIRDFMLSVISRTYSRIEKENLQKLLNVDEEGVDNVIKENRYVVELEEGGAIVRLPANPENQPKPKKIGEVCSFKQASRIIF